MKGIFNKYKKLFMFLFVVTIISGVIFGFKHYKDSHLSYGTYRRCEGERCQYLTFNKSGKVYMIEQCFEYMQREHYTSLLTKDGINNVVKKCAGDGYYQCKESLNIDGQGSGIYSLVDGKVKIEWEYYGRNIVSYADRIDYYKVKDGNLWLLDNDLEITETKYYPFKG